MSSFNEFALAMMDLEDASASRDQDERIVTVTYSGYSEGEISISPILDEARELEDFAFSIEDVVCDFDAGVVRVEVTPE